MYLHYFYCLCFSKRKDPTENFGEEEPSLGQIYIMGFSNLCFLEEQGDMCTLTFSTDANAQYSRTITCFTYIMYIVIYNVYTIACILVDKSRDFLLNLRFFRTFIGIWNVAMMICMIMWVLRLLKVLIIWGSQINHAAYSHMGYCLIF